MFKNVFIFLLEYPFVSAESHRLKIYEIMEFIYTQEKTTILSIGMHDGYDPFILVK